MQIMYNTSIFYQIETTAAQKRPSSPQKFQRWLARPELFFTARTGPKMKKSQPGSAWPVLKSI